MSVPVTVYSTTICPYCVRAKQLLSQKGVAYEDINLDRNPELRSDVMRRSGRRTVPQIWVGETHVGGFDELWALDRAGKLDPLLAGN
ncbi:glutaredoxin 3 [Simiduia sp. 21SJ11W-1]|uniref:glutaredoxin 3 n=1 Tax=Simiduia sp. 21SJ11W-1 TaxID=2909669 RepID=UPI00209F628D|nr:glutaredoxin 3 [Simiduia sp. 21SJ11W-1]UTA48468.1 glutaredoxin 3 [Simiduia sp. 21SJ11W-1]